jgi:glycosyltransferase involved in cell wall biosynthesis
MNIYYWCPFLSKVATVQAVLNSAISVKKYSKNKISPYIINTVGEWNQFKNIIDEKNIKLVNFIESKSLYKSLPRYSYLKSRFSYIVIFILTILQLYKFLDKRTKDDIFVIHLISSLPLFLILLFNFKCKFILRISGYPKLNFFRKLLWKLCKDKLSIILCPTEDTKENLISKNIFNFKSYHVLCDPIIEVSKFSRMKREKLLNRLNEKKYIINIGRLTRQKNQKFLIEGFNEILKLDPNLHLIILGEGELENELKKLSSRLNIENRIFFLGYRDNVYNFLNNAKCFILTSDWEDPGFVLIEAAFSRVPIISSNCPNGPNEILDNGNGGYLFKSNDQLDFISKFKQFSNDNDKLLKKRKLNVLKKSKNYTCFRHFQNLQKILISSY